MENHMNSEVFRDISWAPYLGPLECLDQIPEFSLNPTTPKIKQKNLQKRRSIIDHDKILLKPFQPPSLRKKVKKPIEVKERIMSQIQQRLFRSKIEDYQGYNDFDYDTESDYENICDQ